jgi:hypothetical protein
MSFCLSMWKYSACFNYCSCGCSRKVSRAVGHSVRFGAGGEEMQQKGICVVSQELAQGVGIQVWQARTWHAAACIISKDVSSHVCIEWVACMQQNPCSSTTDAIALRVIQPRWMPIGLTQDSQTPVNFRSWTRSPRDCWGRRVLAIFLKQRVLHS